MNQLTTRGFDDELASRIRQLATREGISLNRAVLGLLRRGAGLGDHKDAGDTVGSSLDHPIGTWTSEEAAEMDRALEDLSYVDEAIRMTGTSGRSMGSHGYTSPPLDPRAQSAGKLLRRP